MSSPKAPVGTHPPTLFLFFAVRMALLSVQPPPFWAKLPTVIVAARARAGAPSAKAARAHRRATTTREWAATRSFIGGPLARDANRMRRRHARSVAGRRQERRRPVRIAA